MGWTETHSVNCEWDFVPDCAIGAWSNRADPSPVTVRMRPITEATARAVKVLAHKAEAHNTDWTNELLRRCVVSVSNMTVDDRPVTTGAQFVDCARDEIYWPVVNEAMKLLGLNDAEKKT